MSCLTIPFSNASVHFSFLWLLEGTPQKQTGGTPPSGHQGNPLTHFLCVNFNGLKDVIQSVQLYGPN